MAINRGKMRAQVRRRPSPPPRPSTPPPHSPRPTPPPSPPYDPMWPIRDEINQLFFEHGFSFQDPNYICDRLVQMWFDCEDPVTRVSDDMALQATSHDRILEILGAIAQDEAQHRHHQDAANIIAEHARRVRRKPVRRLIPDPRGVVFTGFRTPPPERRVRYFRERKKKGKKPGEPDSNEEDNSNQTMYPPQLDKYSPLPRVRFYPQFDGDKAWFRTSPEEKENAIALRWLDKFTQSEGARNAILDILCTEGHDRGLDPLLMLDDPLEVVLKLPEKMPLVDGETPYTDPGKQNEANWPLLEVYDSRRGSRLAQKRLLQTNYITKFIAVVRRMVTLPEVAKKYAIIFRAHPSRYQEGTPEELVDEEAPTTEEVECIIDFFSMAFPVIDVVRTLETANGLGVNAEICRDTEPNLILINGDHFDAIEDGLRNGVNIGHYFYFLMVIITHELGHYLYGCIYYGQNIGSGGQRVNPWAKARDDGWPNWPPELAPGGPRYNLDTPRRLRVNIDGSMSRHPYSEGYDPLFYREGEMGEIIEWLVYGFLSYIYIDGDPYNYYKVVCWGSNRFQGDQQIKFHGYVGTKLFTGRPPVRMNGDQLRGFIAEVEKEEAIYLKAEKAARRVYATEIVRVPEAEANALADAERIKYYREAGKAMPEMFRLRPKRIFLEETELNEGAIDEEMEENPETSEKGDSDDDMEIDLPSDADEHYIARKIPRGSKFKRYHQCIHRINAEKLDTRKRNGLRSRMRTRHNNPNRVSELRLGVPSRVLPLMVWEFLRLMLALSLPVGLLGIFKSDLYWIEKAGFSLRWDLLLTVYVCCLSLPMHMARWGFPRVTQVLVGDGQKIALWVAFAFHWDWLVGMLGLPVSPSLLFWIFLLLGLWKAFWRVVTRLRQATVV